MQWPCEEKQAMLSKYRAAAHEKDFRIQYVYPDLYKRNLPIKCNDCGDRLAYPSRNTTKGRPFFMHREVDGKGEDVCIRCHDFRPPNCPQCPNGTAMSMVSHCDYASGKAACNNCGQVITTPGEPVLYKEYCHCTNCKRVDLCKACAIQGPARFHVPLFGDGFTCPYKSDLDKYKKRRLTWDLEDDGDGRIIWPDEKFPGFPAPPTPYKKHHFNMPGYSQNSMPLLYMNMTSERGTKQCLFLIDSGARWDTFVKLSPSAVEDPNLSANDTFDFTLKYPTISPLEVRRATGRIDARGNVSPRENSVLGPAWMFTTFPLFEFSQPPPPEQRIAIYFPQDVNGRFIKVNIRFDSEAPAETINMKLDTGAPYSTFPLTAVIRTAVPAGTISVFKWFDSEQRSLYSNVVLSDTQGRWAFASNMTARNSPHGLLGMDFLLSVKPLIVYVDAGGKPLDLPGQRLGVDFLQKNVMKYI